MKLPLNSIKEFCDCNIDLQNILDILSKKVGDVEGYTELGKMYEGIYIAQIVSKEEHPNADKLGVYKINIGEEEEIHVVAGDKTLEVGNKVAYIKPGNIVPSTYTASEPLKIKAVNMRGINSNGMLCSEKELNIGPDHSHVLKLDQDAEVGVSFAQYYELNDTVIDIENKALTNRGDLFGVMGLAREIAAAQDIQFISPNWYKKDSTDISINPEPLPIEVKNESSNLCPRYMCISMDNIEVKESPVWLKSLLIKSSMRPINNIVDITNYLSLITAQPLHAFDYDKVVSKDPNAKDRAYITVRLAKDSESIHTLDGNTVKLTNNNLVIADSTNPIAIAGVIGGYDTQVDSGTKRVIIESANFNKFSIRKTSMELGIFTDSVTRYTKGQSPQLCLPILLKAIDLIQEFAKGQITSNIKDIYPEPAAPKSISLSISKLNTHLGTTLGKEDIKKILLNLEYNITNENEEYLTVLPPIFRTDIFIPEDIFEDLGRIYGYENIILRLPTRDTKAVNKNMSIYIKSKIRSILSNSGCNEIDTYSFTSKENILNSKQDPNIAYHIKNSLSPDLEFMRTSLLTSLLEKAKYNIQKNVSPFCIYEFNIPHQKGYTDNFELPKEDWHLSILFSSKENIIDGNPYYQIKRYFEKVLDGINVSSLSYELISDSSELDLPLWIKNILPSFDKNGAALIKDKSSKIVGVIGDIDTDVKNNFKLPQYTCACEINLDDLIKLINQDKKSIFESKYPTITQDLCLTVSTSTKYSDLQETVSKVINTKDRIGNIKCLDIYQKDNTSKNITLRISIEHKDKTLSDDEFKKIVERVEEKVKEYK
ncbi:phenylalanine--tRNA ligase subunit beta [Candidatus Dojkabacteria bacterium]|nr:phenylalanine--tRNA ligase subunit beta [Candidatus Dojkabacteria bacterium]